MTDGTVIFINGTSSSGKTAIVHALQNLLVEPYLEAGIDKFIFMMPERYLDRPLWDDVLGLADKAGDAGHDLVHGMHRAVAELSRAGCNVVADHVVVEAAWARDLMKQFADLPVYLVGIQCPLGVLEERERSRKNRTLGQAKLQFPVIHQYCRYDLEVDTSNLSPEECALHIKERLSKPPQALKQMRQML